MTTPPKISFLSAQHGTNQVPNMEPLPASRMSQIQHPARSSNGSNMGTTIYTTLYLYPGGAEMDETDIQRAAKKFGRPEKIAARLDPFTIPFGKYKGHLVRKLPDFDPKYANWLVAQIWFKMRFPDECQLLARAIHAAAESVSVTVEPTEGGCIVYRPASWRR
jgi:uncharacterized protein (DUF3820 family)